MSRLTAVDPTQADGGSKELLEAVRRKLGTTPNLFRVLANSPAALKAYLDFSSALAAGSLNPRVREQIALAVAEANRCEYCLAAHTAIGKKLGLSEEDLFGSRQGTASDPKVEAALEFAGMVVVRRGQVSDVEVDALTRAGYSQGEIAEIVAHVALNTLTNYINLVAQTEVDFPKVALGASA